VRQTQHGVHDRLRRAGEVDTGVRSGCCVPDQATEATPTSATQTADPTLGLLVMSLKARGRIAFRLRVFAAACSNAGRTSRGQEW
jgi:hypothetical protein